MREHNSRTAASISTLIVAVCLAQSCVAYKLSSSLLDAGQNGQASVFLQTLVLGVDRSADGAQSFELKRFVGDLTKAGVFKSVEYMDRLAHPDLVLTSFSYKETAPYEACPLGFAGEVMTIATAGLVPQICHAKAQVSFGVYSPADERQRRSLLLSYNKDTIFGWLAVFYIPSSAWSAQPEKDERAKLLKAFFLGHAPDLESMVQKPAR
jgi:hypothetical protein